MHLFFQLFLFSLILKSIDNKFNIFLELAFIGPYPVNIVRSKVLLDFIIIDWDYFQFIFGPLINDEIRSIILKKAIKFCYELNASGFIFFSFRLNDQNESILYEVNSGLCGDGIADKLLPAIFPNHNFFEIEIKFSLTF